MLKKLIKTIAKYSLIIMTFIIAGLASGLIVMNIVIKSGKVTVPDITKKPLDQALIILGQNNLYPIVEGTKYDKDAPAYYIISQKPEPGNIIKKGRMVKIIISKGPRTLLIPNLSGQTLRDIELALTEKQLRIGDIIKVHSPTYTEGICISQDPRADEKGSPGDFVNLLISLGKIQENFLMPNLIKLKQERAFEILDSFKVEVKGVKRIPVLSETANIVLEQEPKPGYPISFNQNVNLAISDVAVKSQATHLKTFHSFTYKVPYGSENKKVRIIARNSKETKELLNKISTPGKTINLLIEVIGKTQVTIFVDGIKTMEQTF